MLKNSNFSCLFSNEKTLSINIIFELFIIHFINLSFCDSKYVKSCGDLFINLYKPKFFNKEVIFFEELLFCSINSSNIVLE